MLGDNLKYEVVAIGPEDAERILGHNVNNRGVRRRTVLTYARDMAAGRWPLAGAPIVIADDGTLLDGQHRLLAVIESGATVEFLVIYGIPRAAQPVIDTGARRSFADVLTMRGEVNAVSLAAITKLAALWDPAEGLPALGTVATSHMELLEFLDSHPELRDVTKRVTSQRERLRGIRPAAFGMFVWLIDQVDSGDGDAFVASYLSGADLAEGSPILALRNFADNAFLTGKSAATTGISLDSRVWVALMVKSWNAWRDGREVKVLVWKRGGAKPERFPIPR